MLITKVAFLFIENKMFKFSIYFRTNFCEGVLLYSLGQQSVLKYKNNIMWRHFVPL